MIPPVPGDGDRADKARDEIVRTTMRAASIQVALLALVGLAVVVSSASTVIIGLGNRALNERTKDCTDPKGACYQRNQEVTAAAIQVVLDYIDKSFAPHRLRNEAENMCQTELFAGDPPFARKGVQPALDFYTECVLRRSGNTVPPPLPPNPLTTTTTR